MGLFGWSGTGGDPVAAVRGGIVSRRELLRRLGRAARITEVSAPAGSRKTALLRSYLRLENAARARENREYVRCLLAVRQPQFAAALESAVDEFLRDRRTTPRIGCGEELVRG